MNAVAASRDIVQMLFYFVCALSSAITVGAVWFARYIVLPMKDRHFSFMDKQEEFMTKLLLENADRTQMHRDNLRKLSEIHALVQRVDSKINCPTDPHHHAPRGAAGHA